MGKVIGEAALSTVAMQKLNPGLSSEAHVTSWPQVVPDLLEKEGNFMKQTLRHAVSCSRHIGSMQSLMIYSELVFALRNASRKIADHNAATAHARTPPRAKFKTRHVALAMTPPKTPNFPI